MVCWCGRLLFASVILLLELSHNAEGFNALALRVSLEPGRSQVSMMAKSATKKKRATKSSKSGGFGKKSGSGKAKTLSIDGATLLRRSMELFDEIESTPYDEEIETVVQYVVTVRSVNHDFPSLSDWVPVCVLIMFIPTVIAPSEASRKLGLPANRREVFECAVQAMPSIRSVPRSTVEYGLEPSDSFDKFVIEELKTYKQAQADALATLGLEPGASAGDIKRAHRRIIMSTHPDVRADMEEEAAKAASDMFDRAQNAYETLGGNDKRSAGDGSSWYERLGGKGRVDFSGVVDMANANADFAAHQALPREQGGGWSAAVCPISDDIINDFLLRNAARVMLAKNS